VGVSIIAVNRRTAFAKHEANTISSAPITWVWFATKLIVSIVECCDSLRWVLSLRHHFVWLSLRWEGMTVRDGWDWQVTLDIEPSQ
jgi:hypothetical protein